MCGHHLIEMFACQENLHLSLRNVYDKSGLFCCIVRTKRDGSPAILGGMRAFMYLMGLLKTVPSLPWKHRED